MTDQGIWTLSINDPAYPELLKHIPDPPRQLYGRGKKLEVGFNGIAIVGARKASAYGLSMAQRFGRELAQRKIHVVSGMALGIDAAAQAAALEAGGYSLAVLGCGVDVVYPPRHRHLYDTLLSQGSIISEYEPGTVAYPTNFPKRNRIISGLCVATVVVEARHKSGSLITARCALDQNRDVLAVPGHITNPLSEGCHSLIQQGAGLAHCTQDIVDIAAGLPLGIKIATMPEKCASLGLNDEEQALWNAIASGNQWPDGLSRQLHWDIQTVLNQLMILELKTVIKQASDGSYQLT